MSSFRDRFGQLTVGRVKELNDATRLTCDFECTVCIGETK